MEAKNLPLFLGISEQGDAVLSRLLKGGLSLEESLAELSREFKVRIRFSEPVRIYIHPYWQVTKQEEGNITRTRVSSKITTVYDFNRIVLQGGRLYYCQKRNSRIGYLFDFIDKVISYEPVERKNRNSFPSYESFKRRFDPLFITDAEIQKLWTGTSSQHGGKYTPADFHRLGPQGRRLMDRFLRQFKGINSTDDSLYRTTEYGKYLSERYYSNHHLGRDISISHSFGAGFVYYASEFHGCGNGRYGLIANKNEFLWLEDD